ncbi:MAG: hypothetical protein K6E47_13070 [Lachnospiraceae bacterium]|nr:hypothetical protein [Lachnospiraceae bacterium]
MKKMERKLIACMIIVLTMLVSSFGSFCVMAKERPVVSLKKSKVTLYITGNKNKVKAKSLLKNYDSNSMTIKLESDDESICRVTKSEIKAVSSGITSVQITIRDKKTEKALFAKLVKVTVKENKKLKEPAEKTQAPSETNMEFDEGKANDTSTDPGIVNYDSWSEYMYFYNLGCEKLKQEKYMEAINNYRIALTYEKDNGTMFNIGYSFMMMGDYENSLIWYYEAYLNGDQHAIDNYRYVINSYVDDPKERNEYLRMIGDIDASQEETYEDSPEVSYMLYDDLQDTEGFDLEYVDDLFPYGDVDVVLEDGLPEDEIFG